MWWAMAAQAGFSLLGSLQEGETAGENKALTEYQNRMRMLSSASAQNSLTTNESFIVEESTERAALIQRNSLRAGAAREVAAAAAGVTGISVTDSMMAIDREANGQEMTRRSNLVRDLTSVDNQRENNIFGRDNSRDLRTNEGPSTGETLMGIGQSAIGTGISLGAFK